MSDTDADDVAGEIAAIEKTMGEDNRAYWKDPAMQERYGELLEARESGEAARAPPEAAPKSSERMIEIEALMKDANGVYWHDQELQDEYRALAEGVEPSQK